MSTKVFGVANVAHKNVVLSINQTVYNKNNQYYTYNILLEPAKYKLILFQSINYIPSKDNFLGLIFIWFLVNFTILFLPVLLFINSI